MKVVTAEQIAIFRLLIDYRPETGEFRWKPRPAHYFSANGRNGEFESYRQQVCRNWNSRWAGKICFNAPNGRGYLFGTVFAESYQSHRMAWGLHYGEWPTRHVDHINGDSEDNRIANLRLATPAQSVMNTRAKRSGGSARKGVSYHIGNKRWIANIRHDGKRIHLGYFDTEDEAADAYEARAAQLHGAYSVTASRPDL